MERSREIGGCDLDRSAYAVPQYQFAPVSVAEPWQRLYTSVISSRK